MSVLSPETTEVAPAAAVDAAATEPKSLTTASSVGKVHFHVAQSGNSRGPKPPAKKKSVKRKRPLPPGQRLIRAMAFVAVLLSGQEVLQPMLGPCESTAHGATRAVPLAPPFAQTGELAETKKAVEEACKIKKLTPGIFAIDPKSGAYVDYNGTREFPAASMIKVPVLVALFNAIDRGEVDAKTVLTMRQDLIGGGSGHLQWRPVGTKLPLSQVSELMIIISDNTATNMIIDLLGGKDVVNKKLAGWGLKKTTINNWLPDLEGTNKTSPYDLVYLLARVDRGEILSPQSRARMLQIMERTKTRTLLPQGIPPGAKIAHKTGDIGSMVGDTGIITAVGGGKYIVAVQVQRPHNDRRANELVRKLSGITYGGFTAGGALDLAKSGDSPAGINLNLKPNSGANPNAAIGTSNGAVLKTEPRVQSENYIQTPSGVQIIPAAPRGPG
ncbi:MAG: serine hydrolase [Cyanobacteria bacterium SZAS LIN-3]|nr:serine hydrolase [Cyanobacteria bacterium SZAS LIN-3]